MPASVGQADEAVLDGMFSTLGFNKHQSLFADVRQSMVLFSMDIAIFAEEGARIRRVALWQCQAEPGFCASREDG